MGANNSISQQSSLFKTYNPEQWCSSESFANGSQLWWNKRTNQHFQVHSIPKTSTIQDLQKYELRYLHSFYLVKVFDVLRINDSQASCITNKNIKIMNYNSTKTLVDNNENVVLIEYIVSRFSAIKWLTFEEALYSLKCIFKGCSLMNSFFGQFDIDQQMIGINQFGKVKIWLNSDFAFNYIQKPKQAKAKNKEGQTSMKKSQNDRKGINQLVRKIFSFVENKVKIPFSQQFKTQIKGKQTFGQASQVIERYAKDNKIYLSQYIAIRNRKNQFSSNEKPKNYSSYYNTNHTEKQASNYNKNKESKLTININESAWSSFRGETKATHSFIQLSTKNQDNHYHGRLDSMIVKKSDSLKKQQIGRSKGSVNERDKNTEKYGQKYCRAINSPPRARAELGDKFNFSIHNFIPQNTRFSLGSPRMQQLAIIAELKRQKYVQDQISKSKEADRRKTQQYQNPKKRKQDYFNVYEQNQGNRKFPPKPNVLLSKRGIQSVSNFMKSNQKEQVKTQNSLQSFGYPFTNNQQRHFIEINRQFPTSNEAQGFNKKNYTECISIYSSDPSKNSTSLETRFPINSPKKQQTEIFYFKSKKNDKTGKQFNSNNQIIEVHLQQERQSPDLPLIKTKLDRKQLKDNSQTEKFQVYLANRRKSNKLGKGLINKNYVYRNNIQDNLNKGPLQKPNIQIINFQLDQNQIIDIANQQNSISHTLMENLNNFDDFQQIEGYQMNILNDEFLEQPEQDYIYQIGNTVQSSVDEMDDPADLKTKLIHIKVQDLMLERQKRQNEQKKRSLQKDRMQKDRQFEAKAGEPKTAKINKFDLDIQIDPFYSKLRQKVVKKQKQQKNKVEHLQNRSKKNSQNHIQKQFRSNYETNPLNYKAFSKKEQPRNPEAAPIHIQSKRFERQIKTGQQKIKTKQDHEPIYNYASLKNPGRDPYGIDAKYNKYVTNRTPKTDDVNKSPSVNANHSNKLTNDCVFHDYRSQKTQKKQKFQRSQDSENRFIDSLKETKKKPKITYQKLKNFLYE